MTEMGIDAIYPKMNLSKRNQDHKIYLYLLRNMIINRANQVWAIDYLNPIFIRDFLGHTDLKVTGIYSKTSVKMKIEALDKINTNTYIIPDKPEKEWTEDEDLMEWLTKY